MSKFDRDLAQHFSAWKTWTPTLDGGGAMDFTSTTTHYARYLTVGRTCFFAIKASGTTATSATTDITFTLPETAEYGATDNGFSGWIVDSTFQAALCFLESTTRAVVRKYNSAAWNLASGKFICINGFYEIEAG